MKTLCLLLLLPLFVPTAIAQYTSPFARITPLSSPTVVMVGDAVCAASAAAATSVTLSYTPVAPGDTLTVVGAQTLITGTLSIADNGGSTYTELVSPSATMSTYIFGTLAAASGVSTITVTASVAQTNGLVACVQEWRDVQHFGNTAQMTPANSAAFSVSVTLHSESGNAVVGGPGYGGSAVGGAPTYTASTGMLLAQQRSAGGTSGAIMSNTGASGASVTLAGTLSIGHTHDAAVVELRAH